MVDQRRTVCSKSMFGIGQQRIPGPTLRRPWKLQAEFTKAASKLDVGRRAFFEPV